MLSFRKTLASAALVGALGLVAGQPTGAATPSQTNFVRFLGARGGVTPTQTGATSSPKVTTQSTTVRPAIVPIGAHAPIGAHSPV
jgi:hypothetical protein